MSHFYAILRWFIAACRVALLILFMKGVAAADPGETWSLADDFSITNGNPNRPAAKPDGEWSYHSGPGPNLMDNDVTDQFHPGEIPPNIAWHKPDDQPWVTIAKVNADWDSFTATSCAPDDAVGNWCPRFLTDDVGGHGDYSVWFTNKSGVPNNYDISWTAYDLRHNNQGNNTNSNFTVDGPAGNLTTDLINSIANDRVDGTAISGSATGVTLADGESIKARIQQDWSGLTLTVTQTSGSTPTPDKTWRKDGSGDWNLINNWSGGIPDNSAGDEVAVFGDVITEAQTVFTNADVSVKGVQFVNPNRYVVAGTGSVTLDTTTSTAGAKATVDVVLGSHEFQAPVNLADETDVSVAGGSKLSFLNQLDLDGNTLNKLGGGELAIRSDLITGAGGIINIQGGTVTGNGTVGGDVILSRGTLSPGNGSGASVVPEPTGLILLLTALANLGNLRRRTANPHS